VATSGCVKVARGTDAAAGADMTEKGIKAFKVAPAPWIPARCVNCMPAETQSPQAKMWLELVRCFESTTMPIFGPPFSQLTFAFSNIRSSKPLGFLPEATRR